MALFFINEILYQARKMRILLVAMPGVGNFGDDLISVLSVQHVYERYPEAEIGVLQYPGINPLPYPNNEKLQFLTYPWFSDLKNYKNKKRIIRNFLSKTDYILIGGGGMIQDSHYPFFIHEFLKLAAHSACLAAKVVLVGVGIGPIKGRYINWYFQEMLSRLSLIQVRDEYSLKYINTNLHQSVVSEDFVAGTTNFPSEIKRYETDTPALGCSIRPWKSLDFDKVAGLIAKICAKRKLTCKLFVFEYERWYTNEYDYAVKLKSYLEKQNIHTSIHCYVKDPWLCFIGAFGSVTCAVAVRFHANILWQKLNIQVLPISYAPKVKSLYEERGGQVLSIDNLDLNLDFDKYFQTINLTDKYELPDLESLTLRPLTTRHQLISEATTVFSIFSALLIKLKKELKIVNKNFHGSALTFTYKIQKISKFSSFKSKKI